MSTVADRIRIMGISATGRHGVLPEERRDGQRFVADVVLHVDTRAAAAGDRLDATVDYAVVAGRVKEILAGEPADLIETVAERIAAAVLADPRVSAVDVVLHKPQAPIPVPFSDVSVEIHRDAANPPAVPAPRAGYRAAAPAGAAVVGQGGAPAVAAPSATAPAPATPVAPPAGGPLPWSPLGIDPEPAQAPPGASVPTPVPTPVPAVAVPVPAAAAPVVPPVAAAPIGAPAAGPAPVPTIADLVLPGDEAGPETTSPLEAGPIAPDELATPALEPEPQVAGAVAPGAADDAEPAAPRGQHAADPVPADRMDVYPDGPVPAVLALGSNVGASQDTLRAAIRAISDVPGVSVTAVGPLARTAAVGGPEQPDFLNTVVLVSTELSPRALLQACLEIEAGLGRVREERWGPRTLDIDLIVHGGTIGVTDDLELPHPRAHERAFVLVPWAQVDPGAVLPGLGGGPVAALAETAPDRDGVRWVNLDWWTAG